jgi:cell division protein FtsQ
VNFWHDARLMNLAANALMAVAIGAMLAGAGWWLAQRPMFALRTVVIEPAGESLPLRHVNTTLLRAAGLRQVPGNFLTVDLGAVRDAFERVPWVRRAQVRRIWPNALRIGIEEHQPLATWGDGRLVNRHGELFAANAAEAEEDAPLLEFSGPEGSELEVTKRWAELRRQVAPLQLHLEAVALSPRYAWSVRLDNGLTLMLGREQGLPISERVARWVALYPHVQARLNRRADTIDLRYPNGFAVHAPGALEKAPPGTSPVGRPVAARAVAARPEPARSSNRKDPRSR